MMFELQLKNVLSWVFGGTLWSVGVLGCWWNERFSPLYNLAFCFWVDNKVCTSKEYRLITTKHIIGKKEKCGNYSCSF